MDRYISFDPKFVWRTPPAYYAKLAFLYNKIIEKWEALSKTELIRNK